MLRFLRQNENGFSLLACQFVEPWTNFSFERLKTIIFSYTHGRQYGKEHVLDGNDVRKSSKLKCLRTATARVYCTVTMS